MLDDALNRGWLDGLLEWGPEDVVPYDGLVRPDVFMCADGSLGAVMHVPGFSFELEEMGVRNVRRRQINALLRNVADDNVTIAAHLVRHRLVPDFPSGSFTSPFARRLDQRIRDTQAGRMFVNDWFLTIMVSPRAGVQRTIASAWERVKPQRFRKPPQPSESRLRALEDRVLALTAYFRGAGIRRLGVRTDRAGQEFSEIAEAFRLILYGRWHPVPNLPAPLSALIYNERIVCKRRGVEYWSPAGERYAMLFEAREYPHQTGTGRFDKLLSADFPFVLTHILQFMSRADAQMRIMLKRIHMQNGYDQFIEGIEKLATETANDLASGREIRGEHYFSLAVHADTHAELYRAGGIAQTLISNAGFNPIRADLGTFAALWSQLPGNPVWMVNRPAKISSLNFTGIATFDNFPRGRERGYWGEPLLRFPTIGGTPYDFTPHIQDVGHTAVFGRVGSGKTVLLTTIAMMADKAGATVVFMDKGRGAEAAIRAAGGRYLAFRRGEPSGAAPLRALPDTGPARAFLEHWIAGLIETDGHGPLKPGEPLRLARGVACQMRMSPQQRSLAGVREFLGYADPMGAGARLEKWIRGGPLGWAFDGEQDHVSTDGRWLGFDFSLLFDDPAICAAMAAYLVHRIDALLDGRRVMVLWDEIRYSLQIPLFAKIIEDFALRFRKQEAMLVLAAQEPGHITKSSVGPELLGQCVNRFVFPLAQSEGRSDDKRRAYMEGVGLSAASWRAITEEMPALPYRTVLLDRSITAGKGESAILKFDLREMQEELAVLSGREENVRLLDRIRSECGDDPSEFLNRFIREARKMEAEPA